MTLQKEIERNLRNQGYKLTNQRKALLQVLFHHKKHFLSAEEIYLKTREKYAKTNFSTIYRNLEILENLGIIHKTNIHATTAHYELISRASHHHHIICKGCGKTEPIDFCPLEEILSKFDHKNFTLTDHKFELYGYCSKCQKKNSSKE
ncbi:Fur family transcriptional regulator [Crassaminicella profunda]|uniref:Fur family transcriptional regulator n=1 Tax=Crassaminicella profunda TaxID=1286698 RepID=UPI001CA69065|nr:Fur family transcriptional regulator [Crassaminicella profunda]QZY55434.1 transcriptional repressor [Crassaminicella profunda]